MKKWIKRLSLGFLALVSGVVLCGVTYSTLTAPSEKDLLPILKNATKLQVCSNKPLRVGEEQTIYFEITEKEKIDALVANIRVQRVTSGLPLITTCFGGTPALNFHNEDKCILSLRLHDGKMIQWYGWGNGAQNVYLRPQSSRYIISFLKENGFADVRYKSLAIENNNPSFWKHISPIYSPSAVLYRYSLAIVFAGVATGLAFKSKHSTQRSRHIAFLFLAVCFALISLKTSIDGAKLSIDHKFRDNCTLPAAELLASINNDLEQNDIPSAQQKLDLLADEIRCFDPYAEESKLMKMVNDLKQQSEPVN